MTWAVATSSIKSDFDSVYSSKFTTSAGLASILSDETGSGGGFVRATAPTIDSVILTTSANITAPTFDVAGTDATGDIWYRNSGGLFTRLAFSAGKALWASSTTGLPEWTNTQILLNPMTSSSTFVATTTHAGSTFFTGSQGTGFGGVSIGSTVSGTTSGNLLGQGTASTTNLNISGGYFNGWASSTSYELATASNGTAGANLGQATAEATCSSGKIVVGGGAVITSLGADVPLLRDSFPTTTSAWYVKYVSNANGAASNFSVYAICVKK